MSYVNEYTVLGALRGILDSDDTLQGLLKTPSGQSKIILGVERPQVCNMPVIHLSFLTREIDGETKMNILLIRVTWFMSAYPGGIEDIEGLAEIGEQLHDLFDDQLPTISGYRIDAFFAESGESSAKDMLQPEGREEHFQSLTFRMAIRRVS